MSESPFRSRHSLKREWVRYRRSPVELPGAFLRAGVAGAYLPPVRLEVPHAQQEQLALSLPHCAAMVLAYWGRSADPARLALLMRTSGARGTGGRQLQRLRDLDLHIEFPQDLQFFRDGTIELNHRLVGSRQSAVGGRQLAGDLARSAIRNPQSSIRLVYRWEERWLRYVAGALREGVPPILFVDFGRLYPAWRGLSLVHAVVLTGGDGRHAWINDPALKRGPVRVGLATLMDSLLPGEPLAALLRPAAPEGVS